MSNWLFSMSFLNDNPTIFNIVHIHITLYFFLIHTHLSVLFLFFVIYVTVSPISNTMLKLHDTWIKFIIIIIIIIIMSQYETLECCPHYE